MSQISNYIAKVKREALHAAITSGNTPTTSEEVKNLVSSELQSRAEKAEPGTPDSDLAKAAYDFYAFGIEAPEPPFEDSPSAPDDSVKFVGDEYVPVEQGQIPVEEKQPEDVKDPEEPKEPEPIPVEEKAPEPIDEVPVMSTKKPNKKK